MKYAGSIVISIILFTLSGCYNNEEKELIKFLKEVLGTRMDVPRDIIPFALSNSVTFQNSLESKYKIIHFIDSMECSECYIKSLYKWEVFFNQENSRIAPIFLIFNTDNVFDIKMFMEKYELNFPYFLDINKRNNICE